MRAARIDANHRVIVETFRALGCSVQSLAAVGKGVPDLVVGYRGVNLLVEIKTATGKPTPDQLRWHLGWLGWVVTVRTAEQVLQMVRLMGERNDIARGD